jgi:M6 family metalloprotease-like protein
MTGTYTSSVLRVLIKILLLTISFIFQTTDLWSAPYSGTEFSLKQPDGTRVDVKVWGDEYYQRIESLDGYTLIRDKETNWIHYAILSEDETEFLPSDVKYTGTSKHSITARLLNTSHITNQLQSIPKHIDISKEATSAKANEKKEYFKKNSNTPSPLGINASVKADVQSIVMTGDVVGLTLLIDFPDEVSALTKEEVENYLNQEGYSEYSNNGSVRDYFYDVSEGQLNYTNHVTAYYTAQNNKAYYDSADAGSYGHTARELITEALEYLEADGFDFSTLTTDSSGRILAINAFYAGYPDQGWAVGLWPHQWNLSPTFSADGVQSYLYQITNIGNSLTLGTFCHENGHMLFHWPDLYDYGYESAGIGDFGLMAGGGSSRNPTPPNPYFRVDAGWETLQPITGDETVPMTTQSNSLNSGYVYTNPNDSKEYFIIESATDSGRRDALPDHGLLIWHVDEDGSNNNEQMTESQHYRVSVEQADGMFHLETSGGGWGGTGDTFKAEGNNSFDDTTLPNALWWDGSNSGLTISNISSVGSTMTFDTNPFVPPLAPSSLIATGGDSQVNLSWVNPVDDLDSITIRRSETDYPSSISEGILIIENTTTDSFTDLTAENNKTYYYSVFALDDDQNVSSEATANTITNDTISPDAVTALTIETKQSGVSLSWVNPTLDFNSLKIKRSTIEFPVQESDGDLLIDSYTGEVYLDTTIQENNTYYYSIFVSDNSENWSVATNVSTNITKAIVNSLVIPELTYNTSSIECNWTTDIPTENIAEISFSIVSAPNEIPSSFETKLPPFTGTFSITNLSLQSGESYYVVLRLKTIFDVVSLDYFSNELAVDSTEPPTPTFIESVFTTHINKLNFKWNNVTDPESGEVTYVYSLINSLDNSKLIENEVTTNTSINITDSGLINGQSYKLKLTAINALGLESNETISNTIIFVRPSDRMTIDENTIISLDSEIDLEELDPLSELEESYNIDVKGHLKLTNTMALYTNRINIDGQLTIENASLYLDLLNLNGLLHLNGGLVQASIINTEQDNLFWESGTLTAKQIIGDLNNIAEGILKPEWVVRESNSSTSSPQLIVSNTSQSFSSVYVQGNYTQGQDASLSISIGGTSLDLYDQVIVEEAAILNGQLDITFENSFSPQSGDSWQLISADSIQGNFTETNLPELQSNLIWNLTELSTQGVISVQISESFLAREILSYPNPFNPNHTVAHLKFELGSSSQVKYAIHTLNGELIFKHERAYTPGAHIIDWNGQDEWGNIVANGLYIGYLIIDDDNSGKSEKKVIKIAVLR